MTQNEKNNNLFEAIINDNPEGINKALKSGANIGAIYRIYGSGLYSYGDTVLEVAIKGRKLKALKILLDKGAGSGTVNNYGETALHLAASLGNMEILEELVKRDVNIRNHIEARDRNGQTALQHAAMFARVEVLKLLLSEGANIEAKDINGRTPLHLAARDWKVETVKLLLEKGANIEAQDNEGATAIHSAIQRKRAGDIYDYVIQNPAFLTLKILVLYGIKISQRDKDSIKRRFPEGTLEELYSMKATKLYERMIDLEKTVPVKLPIDVFTQILAYEVKPDSLFSEVDIRKIVDLKERQKLIDEGIVKKKETLEEIINNKVHDLIGLIVTFASRIKEPILSNNVWKGFAKFVSPITTRIESVAELIIDKLPIASTTQKLAKDIVKSSAPLVVGVAAIKAVSNFVISRQENKTIYESSLNALKSFATTIVQGEIAAATVAAVTVVGGATIGAGAIVTGASFVAACGSMYLAEKAGNKAKKVVGYYSEKTIESYKNRNQAQVAI
ncbi:MAG: ankyrin repeat domain-containing protein [Alphaproteobacteria bacterium]